MVALPKHKMTVDEYLAWARFNPGRYELVDGEIFAMSPQSVGHGDGKFAVALALRDAVARAGVPCFTMTDGMTVRITEHTAFEPDALVYCGKRADGDAVEIPNPLIVVEVLSPSTEHRDKSSKLIGYFKVESIAHYLIVDLTSRAVIHHRRADAGSIETRIHHDDTVRLDPPGIEIAAAAFLSRP